MNMGKTTARRARAAAALACLAGLTLAGCGTYRAGAAGHAGMAGQAGQAQAYGAMLGSSRPGRPVPPSAIPKLAAIAKRFARINGGHALTQATAVFTTHRKALTSATPGDLVPGSGGVPVYLVTMQGRFVAYGASGPVGAAAPTGKYASLVVDARTFDVLDLGIGPKPPPVSPESLGAVTDLLHPVAGASR